jgi:hypothetical protein
VSGLVEALVVLPRGLLREPARDRRAGWRLRIFGEGAEAEKTIESLSGRQVVTFKARGDFIGERSESWWMVTGCDIVDLAGRKLWADGIKPGISLSAVHGDSLTINLTIRLAHLMARKIEEELVGYQFAVRQVEVPVTDEKGNPVFNGGDGGVKTQPQWILDLFEITPHQAHIVHIPFSQEGKAALVQQLTGGIAVVAQMPGSI